MFFQSRPGNPPAGEVYIYPDAETGRPVWQDEGGVHEFGSGSDSGITGATLNGEEVPVEERKLVLDDVVGEDNVIDGAIVNDEPVEVEDKKLLFGAIIRGATLNGEDVAEEDGKLVLDGIGGGTAATNFTFVVDSDEALAAWANNTVGNDYTSVLIKPGEWTSNKNVNLTIAGTKVVVGMPGSLLSFSSLSGLTYLSPPTEGGHWMFGVNVEGTLIGGVNCFFNCINLINCTGTSSDYSNSVGGGTGFNYCINLINCTGTSTGSGVGNTGTGFRNSTNLTNCTGTGTGAETGTGFRNCTNLTNCTGSGTSSGVGSYGSGTGFYGCTNLTSCTGTGTKIGINSGAGSGYGFKDCRIMMMCKPGSASTTATYSECYMHASGVNDPVLDTADGGWNVS